MLHLSSTTPVYKTLNIKQPWVEKYRPTTIDELVVDDNISEKMNNIIQNKNMPNIILTGTPGCGKTSTILCIANQIIGKTQWDEHVVELNASNNRGLDIIHNSIIHFCKKKNGAMHKILILDEADNITNKAQHSLSSLMDQYLDNTRFAFTCNDINKIIESIQSRCIIVEFQKPSIPKTIHRLQDICRKENIEYTTDGLHTVLSVSGNDLRQSINNMELVHHNGPITRDNVYDTCDIPYSSSMERLIVKVIRNDFHGSVDSVDNLIQQGYSRSDICLFLIEYIKTSTLDNMTDFLKIRFIDCINNTYININNGHNTNLQLYGCVGEMVCLANN